MKQKEIAALIQDYLRQNRGIFVMAAAFTLIFGLVFWLYQLPFKAVSYAWLLCVILAACVAGRDFARFYGKCGELERLKNHAGEYLELFPKEADRIERLYQELLMTVQEEKKKILETEEAKRAEMTDYYTMWVHQVKTPIAAMNLMLQTGQEPDSAGLCAQLFKIEEYVEMVLQYLRADSPANDLVLRELDLDAVLKKAVHKYAPVFIRSKLALNYKPVSLRVVTDEKWLQFVLEQVLSNALKYTEQGGISVYLEDKKVLVIEDSGTGIAPEDMPRVFEKGYTGNNGRLNQNSTGIGLYLCQKIMRKLSHEMTIESKPGTGTKVKLFLNTAKLTRL